MDGRCVRGRVLSIRVISLDGPYQSIRLGKDLAVN